MLPSFTIAEFLSMMSRYNSTFWPLQLVAYALGCAAVVLAFRSTPRSSGIISTILALFWLWVGVIFNWVYFRPLYSMAIAFVVLFAIEAGLLVFTGVFRQSLSFRLRADARGVVGALLVLYGMVGYPVIEYLLGRGYPSLLPFGLAPCPLTVFTLGLFLWTDRRLPWYVLVIPFLYSLSGVLPVSLGIVEDIGLVAGGLAATCMILYRDRARQAAG